MKALLNILIFVALSHCDDEPTSPAAIETTSSTFYNESFWNASLANMTTTEMTTTEAIPLSCHVCTGDYMCEAPVQCKMEEKYCVIVITEEEKLSSTIKYCAELCPFALEFEGRVYRKVYTGCCISDLCNYQKIGEGRKLGASIPVVTMMLMACFTGGFKIGL